MVNADNKILKDLETLSERIQLCKEMLLQTGGVVNENNEALLGVIGFLEACEPRMVELVESATQAQVSTVQLQSDTLMKCLEVNDSLIKILDSCSGESSFAVAAYAQNAVASKPDANFDYDDLLLESTGPITSMPPTDTKNDFMKKPASTAKKGGDVMDEFDAFLNERNLKGGDDFFKSN